MKAVFGRGSKTKSQPSGDIPPPGNYQQPPPSAVDSRSADPPHYRQPDPSQYREDQAHISRTTSNRLPSGGQLPQSRPQAEIAGPQYASPGPVDDRHERHERHERHGENRLSAYTAQNPQGLQQSQQSQQQLQNPQHSQQSLHSQHEKEHKRGFREKLGLGHSSKQSVDQPGGSSGRSGSSLGRSYSVRTKNQQVGAERQPTKLEQQQQRPTWAQNSSSSQLLAHSEETEESQHSRYAAQLHQQQAQSDEQGGAAIERFYAQPGQHQRPQDYYPAPQQQLHRIDTNQQNYSHLQDPDAVYSPAAPHSAYIQQHSAHPDSLHEGHHYARPPSSGYPPAYHQDSERTSLGSYDPHEHPYEHSYPPSVETSGYQDPSSAHPSRASFEQQQYRQAQQELAHIQGNKLAAQPLASNQAASYLQPPGGATIPNHPPPSPLQPDTQNPIDLKAAQPPSPADPHEPSSAMPRDPQARGTISRATEGRGGQTGRDNAPPTPGYPAGQVGSQSQQARLQGQQGDDKGRDTPPPTREMTEEDVAHYQQLAKDHKELRDKYQKVKKYYFEKEAQVHQLQNSLAHQKLSLSRTSLDDSEYTARFGRLDGLISQLAFAIRKDWKTIPEFLRRSVNKDAVATGKQEMTAVGRAFITAWIHNEIFTKYFHPDLELNLSAQLKQISNTIRRTCPPFQSAEEEEALNSKLMNWRMTTVEGLQDQLKSPQAAQNHARLVELLNEKLIADIQRYLQEPAPADLNGGVYMIIELAVNIATHVPVESRDVLIEFFHPGDALNPALVKVETGIPALVNPILAANEDSDQGSLKSDKDDRLLAEEAAAASAAAASAPRDDGRAAATKKGSMFSQMLGTAPKPVKGAPASGAGGAKGSNAQAGGSQTNLVQGGGRDTPTQQGREERVRFAVGLAVQIRGRSVLVKAPVYGMV